MDSSNLRHLRILPDNQPIKSQSTSVQDVSQDVFRRAALDHFDGQKTPRIRV
jgi:hypothetical protein